MKIERSIIRRDALDPARSEGERTIIELDPDRLTLTLAEFRRVIGALDALVSGAPKRRRRARRRR